MKSRRFTVAVLFVGVLVALYLFDSQTPEDRIKKFLEECFAKVSVKSETPPLERLFRAHRGVACFSDQVVIEVHEHGELRSKIVQKRSLEDRLKILFGKVAWIRFRSDIHQVSFVPSGSARVECTVEVAWQENETLYREEFEARSTIGPGDGELFIESVTAEPVVGESE